jgi:UDP-2-acetamido-3-amino-2,3-dideoxy-glucuronate N-acetyltransferase
LKNKYNICVVGAGKWGFNHVKTLVELNALGGVVDTDKSILKIISKKFPKCKTYEKLSDIVIKKFDGFIIATEPSTHFELAKQVILNHKPVLVEKPLTLDYKSSKSLCDLARKMKVNLMVGHVLLFHPAFQKMKNIIENGKIGDIQYIYSNRLNLGTFRTNENVFWSFAPHDIALFNYFFNQSPVTISSSGVDILQDGIHDSSITTFTYEGKKMGHIFVSWLHPFKEHRFVIIGSNGMLHFEDSINKKPLYLYDKKAEFVNSVPSPVNGGVTEIKYGDEKALTNELKYFISNLDGQKLEISNGLNGLEVVKILEKASQLL